MTYRFYGWQNADIQDFRGLTPRDYYDILSGIWCAATCAPRMRDGWTPENPTYGQCSITAFLMQDMYGGKVYGVPREGGTFHCFNVIGDCVFDLTSEQFGEEVLCYDDCPEQFRGVHFAKAEKKQRYEYLRERLTRELRERCPDMAVRTMTIVSLSSGIIGEKMVRHEVKAGLERLEKMGLRVKFSTHAGDGIETLKKHPEYRAADLLEALRDPETDMIMTAIGGDDTYRLLPYLFGQDELMKAVEEQADKPKIFLGFSDTTVNHLMLHKTGMKTFYGQAFLPDICEPGKEMLPYTRKYFEELLHTGTIREITPGDVWYEERTDFSEKQFEIPRVEHPDHGFELLQGNSVFSGKILGGCIDTIYDIFDTGRYADSVEICSRYHLFPEPADWKGRILLLETSEEQPSPEKYRDMLTKLKEYGLFAEISGLLAGKPMDEKYADAYKTILREVVDDPGLPILFNVNIGHGVPRCIIPFGREAVADAAAQKIRFVE